MDFFDFESLNVLLGYQEKFNKFNLHLDIEKINIIKEKFSNKDFVVSVLGSMKAGKSTFINSLLGADLMPSENAACTLTTTEIINIKGKSTLQKKFKSGKYENLDSDNLSKIFHDEIRKSRNSESTEEFKYILNHNIKCLDTDDLDIGFKFVDTPGCNEMSGLGVDKNQIIEVFDKQLKQTDYIIYVLDYKYYKADDNVNIIRQIMRVRPDIIKEQNIIFILNKVDLITYKDGSIEDTVNEVSKLLDILGIKDAGILPFSAKKAFLYKLLSENQDISLYEEDIENLTDVIEKEINGQVYTVKMPINELVHKFYNESNIQVFEDVVLKQVYDQRERLLLESLNSYKKNVISKFLANNEEILQALVDETSNRLDTSNKVFETYSKIILFESDINDIKRSLLNLTKLAKKDIIAKNLCKSFDYVKSDYINPTGDYDTYYSSEYDAKINGKTAFRNWKSTLDLDFLGIYNYYSDLLKFEENEGNSYFTMRNAIIELLEKLKTLCENLEKLTNIDSDIIINSRISVIPKPIMNLSRDNSAIYTDDPYDNSTFVDYDTEDRWVEGFFGGLKEKEVHTYDISDAMKEEEKDAINAKNSSSKDFFNDYYKKDCEFKNEVKKLIQNEVNKVDTYYKKIKSEFKKNLNKQNKKKLEVLKTDVIEIVSIYNKLEEEIQED